MRRIITPLLVLGICSLTYAADTPATVTLKSIIEKREKTFEKDSFAGWNNNLELKLYVDGAAVKGATKYGHLQIKSATDDTGTNLTKKGEGPSQELKGFDDIRQRMTFGNHNEDKPKPTGFDFTLTLPTPSARAAKTVSISATLEVLAGGEKKIVEVKDIKGHLGKTIEDPALKAVGVSFQILDPAEQTGSGFRPSANANKDVVALISGKVEALASVHIVNKAGKKLNNSAMWSDDGNNRTITYECNEPLPADAVLQLEVWPGQKTVTVPIELKDVKLP